MIAITADKIAESTDLRLSIHHLFSMDYNGSFHVLSLDEDDRGGYARGNVGNQLVRFDLTGRKLTRQWGYRVRITVLEDTGDAIGTLTATGESWTGHQIPSRAIDKSATERKFV